MRILNIILIIIICILLLMSTIALIAIHWSLSEHHIDFSPKGLETYLSAFGNYKALFTGTIAVCSVYFGLQRVKVSEEANREKIKQDYFNEWKTIIQVRAAEVDKNDKFMLREIVKIRHSLYNDLYALKFQIINKTKLTEIFDKHLKSRVRFFEEQNDKHIGMGGAYPDENYSYSFNAFLFIFWGMIDKGYDNLGQDLKEIYLENMDSNRFIDKANYKIALQNYRP
ncbi:MAG: hypothetical protein CMH44_10415 [Muricauda sp.]|nr:hypothetical protein [Allomuricauda sp.]